MTTEKEKAEFGAGTFKLFCEQFGEDVYSHVLLEVLLEGIINAETLFVLGEQEEGRDQADHSSTGRGTSELGRDGSNRTDTSPDVDQSHPDDLLRE
jgi:hypothetical protein